MILIDPICEYPPRPGLHWTRWSHLASDVSDHELHAFAARIGLRRKWFQAESLPHHDVTPSRRARAVTAGAVEVSARELAARLRARIAWRMRLP